MFEFFYLFIFSIILSQLNNLKIGLKFVPFLFFLFLFILFSNFFGLLPYSFTLTSQIIIDFFFSISLFFGFTFFGIYLYGYKFIYKFIPSNISIFLKILIFVIELLSYFIRPISLALRLFANMVAGHSLLHLISGFLIFNLKSEILKNNYILFGFFFFSLLPIFFYSFILILEIGIAFLQSYVFLILSSMYLFDVVSDPETH